jgi:hypothetical protein
MWLHNRAIVLHKEAGSEWVLRRVRLGTSAEESTVELCLATEIEHVTGAVSISHVIENYAPTGRQMSILRAPL